MIITNCDECCELCKINGLFVGCGDSTHDAVWAHEIFAVSTYDTDYILIKENNFADAISVLGESGYTVEENKGVLTE